MIIGCTHFNIETVIVIITLTTKLNNYILHSFKVKIRYYCDKIKASNIN